MQTQHLAWLAELLPCRFCPHLSLCCRRGVSLTDDEAAAIIAGFGANVVIWNTEEKGYRTRVEGERCTFYNGRGCRLHDTTLYPRLCLNYPWYGLDGQVYEYEIDICPEMLIRPDLSVFLDQSRRLRSLAIESALEEMALRRRAG